jgi:hypothetical protein
MACRETRRLLFVHALCQRRHQYIDPDKPNLQAMLRYRPGVLSALAGVKLLSPCLVVLPNTTPEAGALTSEECC